AGAAHDVYDAKLEADRKRAILASTTAPATKDERVAGWQIDASEATKTPTAAAPARPSGVAGAIKLFEAMEAPKKAGLKPSVEADVQHASAVEMAKLESEMAVQEQLDKCVVCKNDLIGDVYICPSCKAAKYHMSCAQALMADNQTCWACKKPFSSAEINKDIESLNKEINSLEETLVVLTEQFKQGKLSQDTYIKRSGQLLKEKEELEAKIKRLRV
nr:hypothetical protein [Candidatus Sigynarchaeota archaeon]